LTFPEKPIAFQKSWPQEYAWPALHNWFYVSYVLHVSYDRLLATSRKLSRDLEFNQVRESYHLYSAY